jgi:hypothetical protein
MGYSLEFRAWVGSREDVDYDEAPEFFDAEFETIDEAKAKVYNDCILWPVDGENQYITISFRFEPKIFNSEGNCVSKCELVDADDMEFEWIDL